MPKLDPSARWDLVLALAAVIAMFLGLGMILHVFFPGRAYPVVAPRVEGPPTIERTVKDGPKAETTKTETPKSAETKTPGLDTGPRGLPPNPDKSAGENRDPRPHGDRSAAPGPSIIQRPRHHANPAMGSRAPNADPWCIGRHLIDVDKITAKTHG